MVIWVSTIIFLPIPTCIFTKCEINLGPKVWYNMRLKNKFHITKMNNITSYQIWPRWFWILGIFTFSCEGTVYKCFTPSGSLHGFVHHLEIPKFVHVGCMHTQPRLYLPFHVEHLFSTPSPCC